MFVFHQFAFVLILKCLVTSAYSEPQPSSTPKPVLNATVEEKKATTSISPDNTQTRNDTKSVAPIIIGEGGLKVVLQAETTTIRSDVTKASTTISNTYGREGELIQGPVHIDNNTSVSTSTETSKPISESPDAGKPLTEEMATINTHTTKSHSRIVPKKGVNFNATVSILTDSSSTTPSSKAIAGTTENTAVNSSTAPKQIRKPTVTTGSENDKDALVKEEMNNSMPKVPTIEYYQKKKEEDSKRSTFIIPIVAVILSVPLVAIVLNIFYKRGKEWWTHRHYRRMDFLIDGMYNN